MKAICAWCGSNLAGSAEADPSCTEISHGVCAACGEDLRFQNGVSLQRFIDSLSVPLLVVNADCGTELANKTACEQLGKSIESVRGELIGPVVTCVNARLPGGCGRTVHCSGCAIRKAVAYTSATGSPQVSPATLVVGSHNNPAPVALTVTTIKTDGMVLLRLERLDQQKSD